jgi:hypothetical protein
MKDLLYILACLIASLAIFLPIAWGGLGANTAYPPSMAATKELVKQIEKTKKYPDSSNHSTVLIDSKLLQDITRVALLSRKEYERASRDNVVYYLLSIMAGGLLLAVLINTEKLRNPKPNNSSNIH